jgi:hypothetical protein
MLTFLAIYNRSLCNFQKWWKPWLWRFHRFQLPLYIPSICQIVRETVSVAPSYDVIYEIVSWEIIWRLFSQAV